MVHLQRGYQILLLLVAALPIGAQGTHFVKQHYSKFEYMIPMRDGVRLFTEVYVPKDNSQDYPILLKRTPYGLGTYGPDRCKSSLGPSAGFTREGYLCLSGHPGQIPFRRLVRASPVVYPKQEQPS